MRVAKCRVVTAHCNTGEGSPVAASHWSCSQFHLVWWWGGEGGVVPCHLDNNDNNDPSPQTMASLHPGLMTAVWRRPGRPSLQILIRAPQSPGWCWPLSPGSRPGPAFLRMHGIAASAWPPSTPPLPSTLHSADQRESTLEAVTVNVILII